MFYRHLSFFTFFLADVNQRPLKKTVYFSSVGLKAKCCNWLFIILLEIKMYCVLLTGQKVCYCIVVAITLEYFY